MKLPAGQPILENAKIRFVDLDAIAVGDFRASFGLEEGPTGYLTIIYPLLQDVLLLHAGRVVGAGTYRSNKKSSAEPAEVFERARRESEGNVHFHHTDPGLVAAINETFVSPAFLRNLSCRYTDVDALVRYLGARRAGSLVELVDQRGISFLEVHDGGVRNRWTHSAFADPCAPETLVNAYPAPRQSAASGTAIEASIKVYRDLLETSFSILANSPAGSRALRVHHDQLRTRHPVQMEGVALTTSGSIDLLRLSDNVSRNAAGRDPVEAFGEFMNVVLRDRIETVEAVHDREMAARMVKEMKLVQIYHAQDLGSAGFGERLMRLWASLDATEQHDTGTASDDAVGLEQGAWDGDAGLE